MKRSANEKRSEPRKASQGTVYLSVVDPPAAVSGRLIDMSSHGFRAVHQPWAVQSGQEVRFRHEFAEGKARVMWTRIAADRFESGFLLIDE